MHKHYNYNTVITYACFVHHHSEQYSVSLVYLFIHRVWGGGHCSFTAGDRIWIKS